LSVRGSAVTSLTNAVHRAESKAALSCISSTALREKSQLQRRSVGLTCRSL
jgi:hypothetical protein